VDTQKGCLEIFLPEKSELKKEVAIYGNLTKHTNNY